MSGPEISRRKFLTGGALIVGFSMTATLSDVGRALAASGGAGGSVTNGWIVVKASTGGGTGTSITVYCPKVELGTGTQTALGQIVVEELYADMSMLNWVQGDTNFDPTIDSSSQGYTAGSATVYVEGVSLRVAAAAAFQELQNLAMTYFGVSSPSGLTAADGTFAYHNKKVSYGAVIGTDIVTAAPTKTTSVKNPADYTIVGTSVQRVDLPAKFEGSFDFSADVRLPGMVYARVLRPSGRNARFTSFNSFLFRYFPAVEKFVNVSVGGVPTNFVYILAPEEYAVQYAALAYVYGDPALGIPPAKFVNWTPGAPLVSEPSLLNDAIASPSTNPLTTPYGTGDGLWYGSNVQKATGSVSNAFQGQTPITAGYYTPFQMHGPMAGSAAVANWDATTTTMTVYSGTQGPGPLQAAITDILTTYDPSFSGTVHIVYTEQSGCYGQDGADDVSAEAALISYIENTPVKLQWTRADEHQWEPLAPAMVHTMQGVVSDLNGGSVLAWQHDVYSPTHNSRPNGKANGSPAAGNLLVAQCLGMLPAPMPAPNFNLATRNSVVNYDFPNLLVNGHFCTSFQGTLRPDSSLAAAEPLTWMVPRSTAMRSLGGLSNSFANESFMDELAQAAGAKDRVAWRTSYLSDQRALAVLNAVAAMPGTLASAATGHQSGRGVSYIQYENALTYLAVICDVDVDMSSGQVVVTDVYVAHDCGLVINPDGLQNQIQGNVIQGISRTLIEQVNYDDNGVTQQAWEDNPSRGGVGYPVIQFDEVPNITIQLLDHPTYPAWGAGEPCILAMPGAIGNAVCDATGARVRTLPMTPTTVLAALAAL